MLCSFSPALCAFAALGIATGAETWSAGVILIHSDAFCEDYSVCQPRPGPRSPGPTPRGQTQPEGYLQVGAASWIDAGAGKGACRRYVVRMCGQLASLRMR